MIIRLTTLAAAALLILRWEQRRRAPERLQQRPKGKPAEVSTWEGEGGALPTVGPQLGPTQA